MRNLSASFLFTVILFCSAHIRAQVPLDSSFTTPGFYTTQSSSITAATFQPDGKLIMAGNFMRYNDQPVTNLIRLQTNGRIDPTFDATAKTNGQISMIEVQADGKILLGGSFSTFKNSLLNRQLIRLNADGTLDNTFTAPEIVRYGFSSVDLFRAQPDGKVLVYGYGLNPGIAEPVLIRLNKNGSRDTSFHYNAQLPEGERLTAFAAQADGKIYVAGSFTSFAGKPLKHIVRLTPAGSVDDSFKTPGFLHYDANQPAYITALVPSVDGTLLVGGSFYYCGTYPTSGIARLKKDGRIDSSFQVSYNYMPQVITKLDTTAGSLLAGGLFYADGNQFMLMRFRKDGSADPTFTSPVAQPSNKTRYNPMAFSTLPDKSIAMGGDFGAYYDGTYHSGFAHFFEDGRVDPSIKAKFQQIGTVYKTLVTKEGKILVGGNFDLYGTKPVSNLVRLLPSGVLDSTFQNTTGPDGIVTQIAETADSEIIISGGFQNVGGHSSSYLARLLQDGTLDTRFLSGSRPNSDEINSLLPLPDGKLMVGGHFRSFGGYASRGIVRLLADGSLDHTFQTPAPTPWYSIGTMALLQNNQVLIGNNSYLSTPDFSLPLVVWKLNEDGSIDNSFKTQNQGGYPVAQKIGVSPAQKIYYSGEVLKPNGSPNSFTFTRGLLRLKANGSNDPASAFPNTFYVNDFKVLGDSAVLACGRNIGWNDSANYIMRFKPDLSIDSSFNPIALFYDLKTLDCMPDGRIVVAGEPVRFFNFDAEPIPSIAILKSPSLQVVEEDTLLQNITGTLNAGTNSIGNATTTQIKIFNTGTTTALLDNGTAGIALIEGGDAASFSIGSGNMATALHKNDSLLLTIQFKPTTTGEKTARLNIVYNNGIKQRYSITLKATATSVITALDPVPEAGRTIVYPNPSNGHFYVKSSLRQFDLFVYDVLGRPVAQRHKQPADQLIPVRLQHASKGVYWLKFVTSKATVIRQVVIQ
jgi:uncharacterized delta-60 repeat protein